MTSADSELEPAWPNRRRDLALVAVGATLLHGVVYFVGNKFPLSPPIMLPMTAVDLAVPFWPWTVFVYLSDYLLVFLAFQGCRTQESARRFVVALFGTILVATALHLVFPVTYPRADYPIPDGLTWATRTALSLLRRFDAPTSCLPSLHVGATTLAALLMHREQPRQFRVLFAWAVAVSLSTLTIKQHYLVDVAAGFAVAAAALAVVERTWPLSPLAGPVDRDG